MAEPTMPHARIDGDLDVKIDFQVLDVRGFFNRQVLIQYNGDRRWVDVGGTFSVVQKFEIGTCDD